MSLWGTSPHLFAHLHLLVTEGGEDSEGRFHHLAEFQDGLIAEFFSRQVFSLLLEEELISEAVVEKIEGWRHSGFSVHSQVRAQTKEEAERVGKYMIRPLLSLERLSFDHLKLTFVAERPPPPHVVSQEFLMDSEAPAEYFP
ncbi:MAG: transposase [Acidobacteriota bacterium]